MLGLSSLLSIVLEPHQFTRHNNRLQDVSSWIVFSFFFFSCTHTQECGLGCYLCVGNKGAGM